MKLPMTALAILTMLAGLPRCDRNDNPLGPSRGAGMEADYEVIRALLADTTLVPCPVIVMVDSTGVGPGFTMNVEWNWLKQAIPGVSKEAWKSFRSRNTRQVPLRGFQCPERSVVFLDARSSWDWERTVPGACGANTVSLAGFNRDRTEALIYWSVYWAPLAAYGSLIRLEKKEGEWVVSRSVMIWIS